MESVLEEDLNMSGLARFKPGLLRLGAASLEDLQYLRDADLVALGMNVVQVRRLQRPSQAEEDSKNSKGSTVGELEQRGVSKDSKSSKGSTAKEKEPLDVCRQLSMESRGSPMFTSSESRNNFWRHTGQGRPRRLIFVRHGESEANIDRCITRTVPDHQIHLTMKGRLQALDAGERLKTIIGEESVKFVVSPYVRTRETLNGIMRAWKGARQEEPREHVPLFASRGAATPKVEVRQDVRIREQEYGNFDSDNIQELHQEKRQFGAFYYRYPGGESPADCFDRASSFLESLYRNWEHNTFENHVIVGHGMMIVVMLMRFCQLPIDNFEQLESLRNCEIVVLERPEDEALLKISYTWAQGEEKFPGGLRRKSKGEPSGQPTPNIWDGDPGAPEIRSEPTHALPA